MPWPMQKSRCASCPSSIEELKRVNGEKLLYEIDLPLTPVLADMEMAGISLDLPFFEETGKRLEKRMAEIEKQVYESVGKPFNLNSTQQLSDILFNRLGLEPPDRGNKTASGHFSTSAGVLDLLRGKHPVVDLVLEHRELSKLKVNLCGCTAGRAQFRNGLCAYFLQPDRRGDGTLVLLRSESAKHPDPHGRGTPHPPWICREQRQCAALRGLLADRAAHRRAHG